MINKIFIKLLNFSRYITTSIIQIVISRVKTNVKNNSLLILRLDTIGDYILFRNFLEVIRNSSSYRNYHVTLCGNVLWKDLAETFDSEFVDAFIWLDRKKFKRNLVYRYQFLREIRSGGFETVIDPTYTREVLFGDQIVKASNAVHRIGSEGSPDKHAAWKRKLFTDSYFTDIINAAPENMFEFFRNKEFFDLLLQTDCNIKKPSINTERVKRNFSLPGKYAVVFPGAGSPERRWAVDNFVVAAGHLINHYGLNIVVAGSESEKPLAAKITSALQKDDFTDLTGKINLSELSAVIEGAVILLTNETGASHIAAAVGCPFVCISNANHYGRFNPYPQDIFSKAIYVYPESFNRQKHQKQAMEKFRFGSIADINEITPEEVIKAADKLLSDSEITKA